MIHMEIVYSNSNIMKCSPTLHCSVVQITVDALQFRTLFG